MTYIGFPSLSLIYLVIFLFLYYSKKRINLFENKIVITLMKINVIGLILELGCYAVLALFKSENTFLGMLILKSYVAYIPIFNLVLTGYIFTVTSRKNSEQEIKKYFYKILLIFLPLTLAIVLVTYIAPLDYNNVYPRYYTYGLATDLILYSMIFLLPTWIIRCIIAIVKNRKYKNNKKIYIILIGIILIGSSGALTNIIDKSILIISSAEAIMVTLMYFTIENPDLRMLEELSTNRKLTETNIEEKSNLLFQVSQEVKNPLMKISNLSAEIEKSKDLNEIHENALKIDSISRNVTGVINSVLDITTIDKQNIKITNSSYNIYTLLKEIIYLTKNKYRNENSDVEFKYSISNTIPEHLYGDALKIKQIICSILFNAFNNTKKGFVDIDVTHMIKYDVCRLIITISDSGNGLSLTEINELLKSNDSIDENEIKKIDSLDINLKLVKKTLDILGGSILVKSDVDSGTTITIILNQQIAVVSDDKIKEITQSLSNKKRVLLIDNNYLELDHYAYELKQNNLEVSSTMYGEDCIEKLKNGEHYDLILVDDELDNFSAIQVLTGIENLKIKNLNIVIMIEKEKEFMKEKFLKDYNFTNYLLKNDYKNEIKRITNEYL